MPLLVNDIRSIHCCYFSNFYCFLISIIYVVIIPDHGQTLFTCSRVCNSATVFFYLSVVVLATAIDAIKICLIVAPKHGVKTIAQESIMVSHHVLPHHLSDFFVLPLKPPSVFLLPISRGRPLCTERTRGSARARQPALLAVG